MNKKVKELLIFLPVAVSSVSILGCNGGGLQKSSDTPLILNSLKDNQNLSAYADMDINWVIDNGVNQISLNSSLKDSGWHLLTLNVARIGADTKPTPVDGLLSAIYPKPSPNIGQAIDIQDLNCKTAVFSKVGDSCSAYFRLKYDESKYTSGTVLVPVQVAPSGNISALLSFTARLDPAISVANYRFANRDENKYYSAPQIASNKNSYQILLMQNSAKHPISITALQNPSNSKFTIIHRTMNTDSDPYYGANAECSLSTNQVLRQVNQLREINESCIVIYQAAQSSTQPKEVDNLQIASNANYFFPTWANKFKLSATYATGANIPDYNITSLSGSITEPHSFNTYQLLLNFHANKNADALVDSIANKIVVRDGTDISTGRQVYSPISSNVVEKANVIGSGAMYPYPDGTQLTAGSEVVNACGGAYASSSANIILYRSLTQQNLVRIHMQNNSNGHCGGQAIIPIDLNMPMDGFNQTVYNENWIRCGNNGDHWEIGGSVAINGSCDAKNCRYDVTVTSKHWGEAKQCHDIQNKTYSLVFPRPNTNNYMSLSGLSNIPRELYYGGNTFTLGMGTSGNICNSSTPETFSTTGNGNFSINARCNGNPNTAMNYAIGFGNGQQFMNGKISFTRSSGYDLVNFMNESSF